MMWFVRFPILCSLLIFLAKFALNKPLPERVEEDLLMHHEEEAEGIMSSINGTREEHVKESLNLTGFLFQEKTPMKLPQYMIDLYNRYAHDRTSMPVSNIIRSFNVEDILSSIPQDNLLQSHILLFNVTIPQHEEVTKAELKLKISVGNSGFGHLSLFDVIHTEPSENLRDLNSFLASKDVEGAEAVTIDVTKAVKRWIKFKVQLNKIEIFLRMKVPSETCFNTKLFAMDSDSSHPPILIIFSDDQSDNNVKEDPMDLLQIMLYKQSNDLGIFSKNSTTDHGEGHEPLEEGKTRSKRAAQREHCTKASLTVNFSDIGWGSFIIYPPSYEAGQCVGTCYPPLTDNLKPTKHALVQSLVHLTKPKEVGSVCCVPTKLDSLQVVYKNDKQISIMRNYEDMKVLECGCR
ncbi:dorsalin-1-like [Anomaloglossus baeobatrachus]|uniref:dorsalin-1-like n=1 Tax=Anomaloglossus baeobatrachus TaxID=238106 RepID=UPI003F4FC3AF